jgi:hypothetical protein
MDNDNTVRVTVTLPADMLMRLSYWSKKHGVTINQYVADAVALSVKKNAEGYTTPTQECERVNKCCELVLAANDAVNSMNKTIISGFDTLLSVTRGYNMFLREEDGDIDVNAPFEE